MLCTKISKKSLKYIKLSENKITDNGFANMIKYLGSSNNLNLSGNLLT